MNAPSTLGLNWKWRIDREMLSDITIYTMRELNRIYGRLQKPEETETKEEEKDVHAEADL